MYEYTIIQTCTKRQVERQVLLSRAIALARLLASLSRRARPYPLTQPESPLHQDASLLQKRTLVMIQYVNCAAQGTYELRRVPAKSR